MMRRFLKNSFLHFNPPIRGSIAVTINIEKFGKIFAYQSPYKGFNSGDEAAEAELLIVSIPL